MIDLSFISFFMPILSFVFIFVISFVILKNTKILGENDFSIAMIGVIIAIIFVSFVDIRSYVEEVIPWFVVLLVLMFFIIFLGAFALSKDVSKIVKPGLVWIFVIALILVFLFTAYSHFDLASNNVFLDIIDFFSEEEVWGSLLLGIVAVVIGLIMTKEIKNS